MNENKTQIINTLLSIYKKLEEEKLIEGNDYLHQIRLIRIVLMIYTLISLNETLYSTGEIALEEYLDTIDDYENILRKMLSEEIK